MGDYVEGNIMNWDQEVAKSSVLTVVYFWHEQCPYCEILTPALNDAVQEFADKIKFVKLNVLENPENRDIASQYGVMSTPTLMFLCNGRPLGQIVGLVSKDDLERTITQVLGKYKNCLQMSTDLRSYIV